MPSFNYNNTTYNAFYYDSSAPSNGDGLTPWTPTNVFPFIPSISANTALIIRRSGGNVTVPTNTVNGSPDIALIGSPKTTDSIYSIIPSASFWASDPDETFLINISGNAGTSSISLSGARVYVDRLQFYSRPNGLSHSATEGILKIASANGVVKSCVFNLSGMTYDNELLPPVTKNGLVMHGDNATIENCTINVSHYGLRIITSSNNTTISNTIVKCWSTGNVLVIPTAYNLAILSSEFHSKDTTASSQAVVFGTASGKIQHCLFKHDKFNASNVIYFNFSNASLDILNTKVQLAIGGSIARNIFYSSTAGRILLKDCEITELSDTSTGGVTNITYPTSTKFTFINTLFNVSGIIGSNADDTTNVLFSGCTFLKGSPATHQPLYIDNIDYRAAPCLICRDSGILYASTVKISGASLTPATASSAIQMSNTSKIFIDNLDVTLGTGPAYNYLNFNSSEDSAIYVKNENNVLGNWSARSFRTNILTSNTYRTGGKNYSLKCQSFSAAAGGRRPYLWIAPTPFDGIPVYFSTTGAKKVTLFIAYKLYDPAADVNINDIIVEIEIPKAASGSEKRVISSTSKGVFLNDTSTWNGDSGLTIKKIVTYFDMLQTGDVKCRIGFYKYQSSYTTGYLVLDPALLGEDA